MLASAGQAFEELLSPPFRSVLLKCVGFTVVLLAGLIVAVQWSFTYFVVWPDWIETTVQWLGGLALVAGSIFLIPPVTSLIAGLYLDDIAEKVEQKTFLTIHLDVRCPRLNPCSSPFGFLWSFCL